MTWQKRFVPDSGTTICTGSGDDKEGCAIVDPAEQARDSRLKGINSARLSSFTEKEVQKAVDLLDRWMDVIETRLNALERDVHGLIYPGKK